MAEGTAKGTGTRPRFVPSRLTSRVTFTMMLAALVVFVIIATLVSFIMAYYTRALASADMRNQLATTRLNFELEARELEALAIAFSDWNEFYDQTVDPDPAFVTAEFDPWLFEHAEASVVVWAASDGTVISQRGDSSDVAALLSLSRTYPAGVSGPVSLPSGPAVVTVRPIVGDPAREAVGIVIVARELRPLAPVTSGTTLAILDSPTAAIQPIDGWRSIQAPFGYAWAVSALRGNEWVVRAALKGTEARNVLVFEIAQPDPWIGEGRFWYVVFIPVGLGLLTIGVGLGIGLVISKAIGRPLGRFVTYMQDQGYLALQGLRADEELTIDPNLPDDFRELGQVIVDLMTQLRINQAELIEAGEQALAAERAFRTVVEESPEVKILVREGVVEIANPAAAHFFGLHLGDLVRASPEGLFEGIGMYDEEGHRLNLATMAERAVRGPMIARCTVPNQPDRWIEISVALLDPDLLDYVISARNVTEERRLEALREEILSLVSHDLRSPLTVVRGYLDMLALPLPDEKRETASDAAKKAADRMEGLLNDLLHATRAVRVFAPTVMRAVDISQVAHSVATSLQIGAEQDIVVTTDVEVIVLGDEVRIEQAITNLIGNAIKHGPAEGQIRVTVFPRNDRAVVTVEDDGPGIPEEAREMIFERGARGADAAGKPGLGLGLYIVRVVAEAHGGAACVEDTGGSGARFVFELPLEQAGGTA
jgi:signal transduction histidine kinase